MSDLDLQFEEFMKEPLSTDESPETNSSSKKTNAQAKLPEPRTFWWMKSKPPAESVSHRSSLSSTSIDEKLESPQLDRSYVPVSLSQKPANKRGTASPEISSSMAEFLEKENLCKELSSSMSEVESPGIDLDDVTDDDIGSIMEQLSQLAGSGDDSAADKSVEEILKEAEDLVRETSHSFSALSEGRDILTVPITPDLILRGQPPSRKSPSSKKNLSPRSGERSRDDRSSSSRSSSAPPTSRKSHRSGKVKGGRMTGTTSAYAISGKTEKRTSPPEGLRRSLSDTRKDADDLLGNVFSAADLLNSNIDLASHYSGESNRVRDTPRKEKTVTFNENFISPEILDNTNGSNKVPRTQASSQLRQENQRTLSKQLSDSETLVKENQEIKTAEVSSRKRKMTELVSISPPLIQHGDVVGTPEAIFQLIDDEVRDEIVAALKESSKETSQRYPENPALTIEEEMNKIFDHNENASGIASSCVGGLDSSRKQPLSIVLEESSVSDISCEVDKTKDISIVSEDVARIETSDKSVQVTDNTSKEKIENLEKELLQEKSKIMQYKAEISIVEQEHTKQMDALKCKHEEEMFKLKKEMYVLNAKIADMEKHQNEGRRDDDAAKEHRIALLETELQQQEQLMLGYQRENVKLCQDMKHLREEMTVKEKNFVEQRQQLALAKPDHEVERLIERLKDKDELIVRLQIEIQALKNKYAKLEHTTEELELSNKTLKSDIEKYKFSSNKTISTPGKTTPRNQDLERFKEELARREIEVDNIRKDLHVTQSELVTSKATVSEYQLQIGELEYKVSELQSALNKERSQNRVQIQKSEDDKKKIQDLNRQVKEMEHILKRHHPNSISALILTANSENTDPTSGQTPRVKFLENRVQQLEQELAKSETEAQDKIKEIQNKFQEMKAKYEEHTSDLELQLATAKHQSHMWRQAAERNETRDSKADEHPVRETKLVKKVLQPPMVITVGAPPPNALAVREDAHLLATIRGLKQELATKDKELVKIRRDLDESFKTNRRLQRERERQLGIVAAPPRPPAVRGVARDEQSGEMSQKSSPNENETVSPEQKENLSRLEEENGKLHQELVRLEEEYRILQTKRLEDLNLLQEEHEAEIDHLISGQMARNSSAHVADLQGQLCAQQVLIDQLKQQLRRTDEYREELELMRVERVHLEKNNMELHKKLADLRALMTPEMLQYEALQEKLSELERRHEVREQKLQAMVKDLLRRNAEQRAQSGDDESATTMREKLLDKNRQLCLYRAEIDRILNTLKEFNRYKKPSNAVK